jgi:hypothetical protein
LRDYRIQPPDSRSITQDIIDEGMNRFVNPCLDQIQSSLEEEFAHESVDSFGAMFSSAPKHPLEITESLQRFRKDHPDPSRTAFLMMQFGQTETNRRITSSIKDSLVKYGIKVLRADEKDYHDDLFPNVLTYIHGCRFGIAVFERLVDDDFNPNVSLEVGYMTALHKSVCYLKDQTLKTLQTDLVGKLYKAFNPQNLENSIPSELERWLRDKDIINI